MMKWWIKTPVKLWEVTDSEEQKMEHWIKSNIGKRYTKSAGHFHFRTKKDAMLFILKWA